MNFHKIEAPIAHIAIAALRAYQCTLSPDHGWMRGLYPYGCCKFHPSCSQYAIDAIACFGPLKGAPKAAWRVLRCHPLSRGGVDPVVVYKHRVDDNPMKALPCVSNDRQRVNKFS